MSEPKAHEAPASGVKNPVMKFAVGTFAALCAAFIPRLGAMLSSAETARITFFTQDYFIVALTFALFIGVVMVILEYNVFRAPKDTFITALGVPALVAGALNAATNVHDISTLHDKNQQLADALADQAGIARSEAPSGFKSLEASPASPGGGASLRSIPWVISAHAAEIAKTVDKSSGSNLGIQFQQRQYVIVLDEAKTKEKALERARQLRQTIPQAQAVQTDKGFLVIEGKSPRNESSAVLEAVRLKNQNKLDTKLLQVNSGP